MKYVAKYAFFVPIFLLKFSAVLFCTLFPSLPVPQYLMVADFVRYYLKTPIYCGCRFLDILHSIVAKKWDPGILDPSRFSAQIRKAEARLGKLAKIRKVETN